jgi:RsiW-degrading membrane proteinase PrsW (M82 family)
MDPGETVRYLHHTSAVPARVLLACAFWRRRRVQTPPWESVIAAVVVAATSPLVAIIARRRVRACGENEAVPIVVTVEV